MTTMWNKSVETEEKIYELDEQTTVDLHPAAHESSSPRLLCVLREKDGFDWSTSCLSDFVRPSE